MIAFPLEGSTRIKIANILDDAHSKGKADVVARHLISALFQIQHWSEIFDMRSLEDGFLMLRYSVFHIAIHPRMEIFNWGMENLEDGKRVFLLVADESLQSARQIADEISGNKIAVESIESFISHSLEWASAFRSDSLEEILEILLLAYNDLIKNGDLMIQLPFNKASK